MGDGSTGAHGKANVITAARPSYDEEFRTRRRRYVIMMLMRLPCLIAAAILYQIPWLAVLIILVSIPLPWCAVLIANDGPARKRVKVRRGSGFNDQRALPGPTREIVDMPADAGAAGSSQGRR